MTGGASLLRTRKGWGFVSVAAGLAITVIVSACAGGGSAASRLSDSQYRGTPLDAPAPDFRLTDHRGYQVRLTDFRGKVVALAFMDTRCDETCPLTAAHLVAANAELGQDAGRAVFLGVNVNKDYNTTDDALAFTERYRLDEIPSWRVLTGSLEELRPVWAAYSIDVQPQPDEEDYSHTPGVYIIDQSGALRWYVSTPLFEEALVERWEGPLLSDLLVQHMRALLKGKP